MQPSRCLANNPQKLFRMRRNRSLQVQFHEIMTIGEWNFLFLISSFSFLLFSFLLQFLEWKPIWSTSIHPGGDPFGEFIHPSIHPSIQVATVSTTTTCWWLFLLPFLSPRQKGRENQQQEGNGRKEGRKEEGRRGRRKGGGEESRIHGDPTNFQF